MLSTKVLGMFYRCGHLLMFWSVTQQFLNTTHINYLIQTWDPVLSHDPNIGVSHDSQCYTLCFNCTHSPDLWWWGCRGVSELGAAPPHPLARRWSPSCLRSPSLSPAAPCAVSLKYAPVRTSADAPVPETPCILCPAAHTHTNMTI